MSARRQRGFALLIVLWTLVLVTLLVTQLNASGRSETVLARNLLDAANAQAAADGAIFEAASRIIDGSERHWNADGEPYALRLPNARVTVRIESESGKIDPNVASLALLEALIHVVGADTQTAESVATSIVQWRFPDATGQASPVIAAAYRASGHAYAPPEAPFQTLDELGLVRGMTPDLLARLRPHLTLFHEADPELRAADAVVAAAVKESGISPAAPPAGGQTGQAVTIVATANATGGSSFTRTATLRIGPDQSGDVYRILEWR